MTLPSATPSLIQNTGLQEFLSMDSTLESIKLMDDCKTNSQRYDLLACDIRQHIHIRSYNVNYVFIFLWSDLEEYWNSCNVINLFIIHKSTLKWQTHLNALLYYYAYFVYLASAWPDWKSACSSLSCLSMVSLNLFRIIALKIFLITVVIFQVYLL